MEMSAGHCKESLSLQRDGAAGYGGGCLEPLPDRDFLSYIWNFERRYAPRIIQEIERHGPSVPVITLKSHGEMAHLLDLAGLPH